ncbi:MAG: glycosyltransferase family 4 protein [Acidimicrobiales bacterium]|nr:glycosyltransferase family 4 protein [Acidimicrobiales bacterium]
MHLVILTQYYRPETGAPQNRLSDLARRARERGHEVTVITAMPNYPSGTVLAGYRRRLVSSDEVDGVRVLRSWIYGHRGRGTVHQLMAYASFAASSLLTAPFRIKRADVLLWESPPIFLAPTAELLARRLGARVVMNVSDLWPETAIDLGMVRNRHLVRFFMWMARRSYRRSDLVLGQTEGILEGIQAVQPGTPTMLVPNGVDCERFHPVPRDDRLAARLGLPSDRRVVVYAGNFGRAQALEQVVSAARQLLAERDDLVVALIGDGPVKPSVVQAAVGIDPDRLLIRSSVDVSEMPSLLGLIDVALVPLADQPIFEGARPSKMFEFLAAGVPFVFCGRGEGADLVADAGSALVVPPEAPAELARAVGELLDLAPEDRAARVAAARAWVEERFDRAAIGSSLLDRLAALPSRAR